MNVRYQEVVLRLGIVVCVLGLGLMACSGAGTADRPGQPLDALLDRDVRYTSELTMDVLHPDAEGPWPVAVVLHGGADHKETMTSYARAVARQGVVVFVPEWRSFPEEWHDHLESLEDVACAVRFARDRARAYGGNGERIMTAGWSAGANFAAIAVLAEDKVAGDCVIDPGVSARAQGLVGLDGAYNIAELFSTEPTPWTEEELNEISAQEYVQTAEGDEPPGFRLFTGQVEELHAQAERFRDDLAQAGYEVELVRHPELSHRSVIFAPGTVEALVELAFR